MDLLDVRCISKRFGGVEALKSISMNIGRGQIVGLIGPNGSGKTTLFDCLTGFITPDRGQVFLNGEDITNRRPYVIALKGMVRTFQSARAFLKLTVIENLMLGIQQHFRGVYTEFSSFEHKANEKALDLLQLFDLHEHMNFQARHLSYGQRKLLTIAMTLMPDPMIILLDEPTAAVNPILIEKMKNAVQILNRRGQTFFIIEHKVDFLSDICDKMCVLDHGEKIAVGTPQDIIGNERVVEAYFGG